MSTFWQKAKERSAKLGSQEVVINLAEKLSKLEFKDVDFIYNLILNTDFKGDEIESATAVLLKIRFIRKGLIKGQDVKDSKVDDSGA